MIYQRCSNTKEMTNNEHQSVVICIKQLNQWAYELENQLQWARVREKL